MTTILMIADSGGAAKLWRRELADAGYRVIVTDPGPSVPGWLREERPDLVFLDLEASGMDPFELCRQLRRLCDAPILVLAPRLDEAERAVVQEGCADDFLLDPPRAGQVLARIRVLLARAGRWTSTARGALRAGALLVDPGQQRVVVAGNPAALTRSELALLTALASDPGRVFTRSQLVFSIYGSKAISERAIDSHVKNLRAKIEPDPHHPRHIVTVHSVGYKLCG